MAAGVSASRTSAHSRRITGRRNGMKIGEEMESVKGDNSVEIIRSGSICAEAYNEINQDALIEAVKIFDNLTYFQGQANGFLNPEENGDAFCARKSPRELSKFIESCEFAIQEINNSLARIKMMRKMLTKAENSGRMTSWAAVEATATPDYILIRSPILAKKMRYNCNSGFADCIDNDALRNCGFSPLGGIDVFIICIYPSDTSMYHILDADNIDTKAGIDTLCYALRLNDDIFNVRHHYLALVRDDMPSAMYHYVLHRSDAERLTEAEIESMILNCISQQHDSGDRNYG